MRKLISLVIFAPIAIILILLSVANRHPVVLNFDPINPELPFYSISAPFYVFLFIAILAGILIGGMATWFTQGKHRKLARDKKREAAKWRFEAEEQKERAKQVASQISSGADGGYGNASNKSLTVPGKAA